AAAQAVVNEKLEANDHALQQAQRKRSALQQATARNEQTQRQLGEQLQRLSGLMAQIKALEQQQRELSRLEAELARLPADAARGRLRGVGPRARRPRRTGGAGPGGAALDPTATGARRSAGGARARVRGGAAGGRGQGRRRTVVRRIDDVDACPGGADGGAAA